MVQADSFEAQRLTGNSASASMETSLMPRISARVCWSRWRPTSPSVGAHLADHLAVSLRMCNSESESKKNSQPLRQLTGCHLADRLYARNQRILRKALEYPTEQQKDRESEVALASWLMALPWACHCLL